MVQGQIAAPSVPDPPKATSTKQVPKRETHGHSGSTTTPTFSGIFTSRMQVRNDARTTSKRGSNDVTRYAKSKHMHARTRAGRQASRSYENTNPNGIWPDPATTAHNLQARRRYASFTRFGNDIMTILGRVMRARSAPRVSGTRHVLGQPPSTILTPSLSEHQVDLRSITSGRACDPKPPCVSRWDP